MVTRFGAYPDYFLDISASNWALANDGLLDSIQHPTRPHQKMFVVEIRDYAYVVPYIDAKDRIFLKTIYPSRKHTKKYLEEK